MLTGSDDNHNVSMLFDKSRSIRPARTFLCDREPRENRGRLRHCYGLQAPRGHCVCTREGWSEVRSPESGYRLKNAHPGLPCVRQARFSAKRRMRPVRFCQLWQGETSLCAFLRDLPEEGIFVFGLGSAGVPFTRSGLAVKPGWPCSFICVAGH